MTEELTLFAASFASFWPRIWRHTRRSGVIRKMVDRPAWRALGEMGALLTSVPETYGGLGATFAYDAAVFETSKGSAGGAGRRFGQQRYCRALYPELRLRGAEASLSCPAAARANPTMPIAKTEPAEPDRPAKRTNHRALSRQQLRHQRPWNTLH